MSYFYGPVEPKKRSLSGRYLLLAIVVAALVGALAFATWAPEGWLASLRSISQPEPLVPLVHASGTTKPGAEWPVVGVAEAVSPSVVGIEAKVYYGGWMADDKGGSGVILNEQGYIVTNNHVVEDAGKIDVLLPDGRRVPARLVGTDVLYDLAVLKVDVLGLKPARFGDSDALKVGELAVAIGNPVGPGFERTVTAGVISGIKRAVQLPQTDFIMELVQTDAAINPGNSGGPLCNVRGEVIGINTVKITVPNVEGMGLAIPSNTVLRVVNDLIKYQRVVRPWLGIYFMEAEQANIPRGVYVVKVTPGSPAQEAGIRPDDILVALNGQEVSTLAQLRTVLEQYRPGDKVKVDILRNGRQQQLTVTLRESPAR